MPVLHFLNVKQGDCNWLKQANGNNTILDVFNANKVKQEEDKFAKTIMDFVIKSDSEKSGIKGNFRQKDYPVNPIEYLNKFGVTRVFRYIQTHPDMDHMGGIKDFFEEFNPINIWDTDNIKEIEEDSFEGSPNNADDWNFYKNIRDNNPQSDPKRLTLFANSSGIYYNKNKDDDGGGDGLHILAPTRELIKNANESGDFNDASYVILYKPSNGQKVIFAGDSHDKTWEYILENHENDVKDIHLLLAPHHGRDSKRNYDFLDVLKPKLTFFGNANSEHLAYDEWNRRGLEILTNNQGNCLLAEFNSQDTSVYCTYKTFAEAYCKSNGYSTHYKSALKAYYLKTI